MESRGTSPPPVRVAASDQIGAASGAAIEGGSPGGRLSAYHRRISWIARTYSTSSTLISTSRR